MMSWKIVAVVTCVCVAVPMAMAQPGPGQGGPKQCPMGAQGPGRGQGPMRGEGCMMGPMGKDWKQAEVPELVRMVMMARLAKRLELNDEDTVLMMRQFDTEQQKQKELDKARQEAFKELRKNVKEDASDEVVRASLDKVIEADKQLLAAKFEGFENAGKSLTPTQQAKLYVFKQEFQDQMRDMVREARCRRMEDCAAPGAGQRQGRALKQGQGPRAMNRRMQGEGCPMGTCPDAAGAQAAPDTEVLGAVPKN